MTKPTIVSSLSMSFKKSMKLTEDREEAKKEHRQNLKELVDVYMKNVQEGKAEGIRNAKDLVEVMKMDLLLMGEATERTENSNDFDEVRVQQLTKAIDLTKDDIRSTLSTMLTTLNDANDEADVGNNKKEDSDVKANDEGISIMADNDALMELANQAMKDYETAAMQDDSDPEE